MALALKDRVKETTIVVGTGAATLLGSSIGFQPFSVVGNGNTTYYCISDQFGSNWEVGIGTYSSSGNTLARTTVLASSNGGSLVVFTAGIKDVFVTYPAEKGVWLDASGNAIGLGTPAAFVGTNITGTASGLTAGNVTTNANLTGAITSVGNATSLGSFTSLQLATALTNETGSGSAVFSDNASLLNPTYTGTLTGGTGVVAIGTNQIYKDASGNVGIGTSSPTGRLQVTSSGRFSDLLMSTTNVTTALFSDNTNLNGAVGTTTNHPMLFYTSNTERMRIDASGNVGIGTSSPSSFGRLTISQPALVDTTTKREVFIDAPANTTTNTAGALNGITFRMNSASYGSQFNRTSGVYGINTDTDAGGLYGRSAGLVFYTSSIDATATERMRIDSSGNLLVGTTSNTVNNSNSFVYRQDLGAEILNHISGTVTGSQYIYFGYNGSVIGSVTQNLTTGVLYNVSSDQRLKTNIQPAGSAIQSILDFPVDQFDWISNSSHQDFGGVAQKILKVIPEMVSVPENPEEMMGVDWSKAVPRLIKTIQELKSIIDTQQEQINSLLGK